MDKESHYPAESIGSRMSTQLPTCRPEDTLEQTSKNLVEGDWQSTRNIYVVDKGKKLLGYIDVGALIKAQPGTRAEALMQPAPVTLHSHSDQEKAVFEAVKNDNLTIPVVDGNGVFLGAVTAHTVIQIMHEEHMEDAILSAGIRGRSTDMVKLATERAGLIFRGRAPWLVLGLVFGLSLGFIASMFEHTLSSSIALAYFIPVVAYIADSVGSQSSAIAVRALATLKLSYWRYAPKELAVGVMLGALLGVLGAAGAWLISRSPEVALTVGVSLLGASAVAATLASSIPFVFKKLGKDPALGSSPIGTALQDVVSVVIYFFVAVTLVSS